MTPIFWELRRLTCVKAGESRPFETLSISEWHMPGGFAGNSRGRTTWILSGLHQSTLGSK